MRSAFVFAILFSVYLHVSADTELLRPKRLTIIKGPTRCKKVVDIALIIDESGSITLPNFKIIKRFLEKTVARFSVSKYGAHFGIIKYSTNARLVFPLNKYTDRTKLMKAIMKIRYLGGWTYTGKALALASSQLFGSGGNRKNVPDVLVIFSDGESQDHKIAVRQAKILKNKGVKILVVAIGKGLTVTKLIAQLGQLASDKKYVFKTAMAALDTIRDDLVKEMCEAAGCATAKYIKQGCFATPQPKPPGTATLLFDKRDNIEWTNKWDQFIDDLVCECGTAASRKHFKYFFIEFYAECWGSNTIQVTGPQAGLKKCWGKRPDYEMCNRSEKLPICVGTAAHGYVYQLTGTRRLG